MADLFSFFTTMGSEFIDEKIEVQIDKKPGPPTCFIWRNRKYNIAKIRRTWFDFGFGVYAYSPKRFWHRRHRTYYAVTTEEGEKFTIYHDRNRREWILYKKE